MTSKQGNAFDSKTPRKVWGKRTLGAFGVLFVFALFSVSCWLESTPPDPPGTITVSLNYTAPPGHAFILYQGPEAHQQATGPRYAQILMAIGDASMNFGFIAIIALDPNIVQWLLISPGMGGELVDVGKVGGLGAVDSKPTAGWTTKSAVQLGHGYVLRFRAAYDYMEADELPYMYARMYVTGWLKSTSGGLLGAKVKYQLNF